MASYRKKHIKGKIHNIKPKHPIFKRFWFWIAILFLIIILSGVYAVLFYPGIQLKNIVIFGNDKAKTQELQKIVFDNANTGLINFWNIKIISRSIFLVNADKISKSILEKFPVIEKVAVNKELPQTLVFKVAERKPMGIFCDNSDKCFLIDQNGVVFEPVPVLPGSLIVVRQTMGDEQISAGKQVVEPNIMNVISKIQKDLKDNSQIDLTEALIASPVRLNVKTSENWQIYFDLNPGSDIAGELTKLNLLLNGEISPDSRKNLYYIDLRPKDRAIICDNKTCGG